MKFTKKYDWMFRRQITNLPLTPEYVRKDFKKWWKELGDLIDTTQSNFINKEELLKEIDSEKIKMGIHTTIMNGDEYGDYENGLIEGLDKAKQIIEGKSKEKQ